MKRCFVVLLCVLLSATIFAGNTTKKAETPQQDILISIAVQNGPVEFTVPSTQTTPRQTSCHFTTVIHAILPHTGRIAQEKSRSRRTIALVTDHTLYRQESGSIRSPTSIVS